MKINLKRKYLRKKTESKISQEDSEEDSEEESEEEEDSGEDDDDQPQIMNLFTGRIDVNNFAKINKNKNNNAEEEEESEEEEEIQIELFNNVNYLIIRGVDEKLKCDIIKAVNKESKGFSKNYLDSFLKNEEIFAHFGISTEKQLKTNIVFRLTKVKERQVKVSEDSVEIRKRVGDYETLYNVFINCVKRGWISKSSLIEFYERKKDKIELWELIIWVL
jgi:hypothetical protein